MGNKIFLDIPDPYQRVLCEYRGRQATGKGFGSFCALKAIPYQERVQETLRLNGPTDAWIRAIDSGRREALQDLAVEAALNTLPTETRNILYQLASYPKQRKDRRDGIELDTDQFDFTRAAKAWKQAKDGTLPARGADNSKQRKRYQAWISSQGKKSHWYAAQWAKTAPLFATEYEANLQQIRSAVKISSQAA